jgi:hypothetical protein
MRAFAVLVVALVVALGAACYAQPAPASGPPTCAQAADHVLALLGAGDDHAHRVHDVLAERCRADQWGSDVTRCMLDEPELHASHHCQDRLTADQRIAFTRDVAAIDALPPAPGEAEHALPHECYAYRAAVDELFQCAAFPAQTREAIQAAYEQAMATWDTVPPDAVASVAAACRAATDAIHAALARACPP